MASLPNLLSFLRMALAPVLLVLAWTGQSDLFIAVFVCSLLSDVADGYLARRLNQVSDLGAKLDSWADLATWVSAGVCIWWLWPDLVRQEAPFVIAMLAGYAAPILLGFLKFGRLTSYHTWGAKLSAVLVGVSAVFLLLGGAAWPYQVSTVVLVVAGLEEIAITAILAAPRRDVPSLWHAVRAGGESHASAVEPK
jgi:CDP-diacylglycerol--glycerol-3-phosphate 3-phosphatidyltransferase